MAEGGGVGSERVKGAEKGRGVREGGEKVSLCLYNRGGERLLGPRCTRATIDPGGGRLKYDSADGGLIRPLNGEEYPSSLACFASFLLSVVAISCSPHPCPESNHSPASLVKNPTLLL